MAHGSSRGLISLDTLGMRTCSSAARIWPAAGEADTMLLGAASQMPLPHVRSLSITSPGLNQGGRAEKFCEAASR